MVDEILPAQDTARQSPNWRRNKNPRTDQAHLCSTCGTPFYPRIDQLRRGGGRYCSRPCMGGRMSDRLWERVDRSGGPNACWPWLGRKDQDGYGRHSRKPAHRVAWELTNGPVPAGICVCHSCDNRICCNPSHGFLGTSQDNNRDRNKKERQARGEAIGLAKLTASDVVAIRTDRRSVALIAKSYGVCKQTIANVRSGLTWKHVP